MSEILWQKSSFSGGDPGSACLELAHGVADQRLLRESDEMATVLAIDSAALRTLLLVVKAGGFDHLA
ncbi:DUF397 domain-containing protein [Kitasatospora purpeofusca]|uniref:DUF397 domain-containing protein n=1 Tax=Kitasatospora purpeofusca TaxID=67352 RepID=A0ABZ1U4R8_9ACTN|nr:DUF397 domain-containing protein [Kitasatospora purpeofusca]